MGSNEHVASARGALYRFAHQWAPVLDLAARVAEHRARAAESWRGFADWRDSARAAARHGAGYYNPWTRAHGFEYCRWVEDCARAGLRFAGYVRPRDRARGADYDNDSRYLFSDSADEGVGWYCDEGACDSDVIRAVVYRLPGGRYSYGYADACNPGAAFLAFDNCTCAREAEGRACAIARAAADNERICRQEQREEEE